MISSHLQNPSSQINIIQNPSLCQLSKTYLLFQRNNYREMETQPPTGDLRSQLLGNTQSDGAVFKTVLFYSVLILLLPIGSFFTTKSIIFEIILGQVGFTFITNVLYGFTYFYYPGVNHWVQHRVSRGGCDRSPPGTRVIYLQGKVSFSSLSEMTINVFQAYFDSSKKGIKSD